MQSPSDDFFSKQIPVLCECGRTSQVSPGSAGAQIPCQCGKSITVPSLATLREMAGLTAVDVGPQARIEQMIDSGELPSDRCLVCGRHESGRLDFLVECEQPYVTQGHVGIEVTVIYGAIRAPFNIRGKDEEFHGRETALTIPATICEGCQVSVPRPTTELRLQTVGIYGMVISLLLFLMVHWLIALPALLLSTAVYFGVIYRAASRQRALRTILSGVPVYGELFRKYPNASILSFSKR